MLLDEATEVAVRRHAREVEPAHLVLAALQRERFTSLFTGMRVDATMLRDALVDSLAATPAAGLYRDGATPTLSERTRGLLVLAAERVLHVFSILPDDLLRVACGDRDVARCVVESPLPILGARDAIFLARRLALSRHHPAATLLHVAGVLASDREVVDRCSSVGAPLGVLRRKLEAHLLRWPGAGPCGLGMSSWAPERVVWEAPLRRDGRPYACEVAAHVLSFPHLPEDVLLPARLVADALC